MLTKKKRKQVEDLLSAKRLQATLRKSHDPVLRRHAKHVVGGMKVLNFLFDSMDDAAQKLKGIQIKTLVLENTTAKGAGEIAFARWVMDWCVKHGNYPVGP